MLPVSAWQEADECQISSLSLQKKHYRANSSNMSFLPLKFVQYSPVFLNRSMPFKIQYGIAYIALHLQQKVYSHLTLRCQSLTLQLCLIYVISTVREYLKSKYICWFMHSPSLTCELLPRFQPLALYLFFIMQTKTNFNWLLP